MNRKWNYLLAALALGVVALTGTGCDKLRARDNLNKGVQAFKSAKYPDAVERFKEAVKLDPTFPVARLYLAMAYMNQYVPGSEDPDNLAFAKAAKEHFLKVLEQDPKNEVAMESMASLNYQEAGGIQDLEKKNQKFDEAQVWYEKLATANPKKKEALYSLGVIAWGKWYPTFMKSRAAANMKPEDPGPIKDKKIREELKAKYGAMIDSGIQNLIRALDIDPNYDEAMAYLNLLYRERADLVDPANKAEYEKDITTADEWLKKTLDTRKMKANLPPTGMAGGEPAK